MTEHPRAAELISSAAFASAPVAYSILDLDGVQLGANAAFHAMFRTGEGLSSAEGLTHPDDAERTASYLAALRTGEADHVTVDKRYIRSDRTTFWGRLTATPLLDAEGRPELLLGVIEDITAHVETLEELRAVSDAKSGFVARVCHDLRAPLHAIAGLSELLATSDLDDRDRDLAVGIGRETQALQLLVDELLDLSRVEAGTMSIDNAPFSLSDCLTDAVDILRAPAADHDLELRLDISDVRGTFVGDANRIRQIVVNLLDNAIKFTPSGHVRVAARLGADDLVAVSVSDTGVGIAADDLASVFDNFAQFHEDRSGSGLGLAISSDLAVAMGGTLTVDSTPGTGSTFTLSLPLPRLADETDPEAPSSRPTVLVVEDSPVNQLLVTNQLDRLGIDAVIAEDGFEAIRRFEQGVAFALVLMDWHLPGIDGLETTRRLRMIESENAWRRTPVVAITARAMSGDRQRCLDAGMDDVVTKPASLADIERVVGAWAVERQPPRLPTPAAGTDTSVLERLVDELGDPAVVRGLVLTFLDQLPERHDRIAAGVASRDLEEIRRAAHTLKSTSAVVGAWKLEQASRTLEEIAARDGDGLTEAASVLAGRVDEAAATLRGVAAELEDR